MPWAFIHNHCCLFAIIFCNYYLTVVSNCLSHISVYLIQQSINTGKKSSDMKLQHNKSELVACEFTHKYLKLKTNWWFTNHFHDKYLYLVVPFLTSSLKNRILSHNFRCQQHSNCTASHASSSTKCSWHCRISFLHFDKTYTVTCFSNCSSHCFCLAFIFVSLRTVIRKCYRLWREPTLFNQFYFGADDGNLQRDNT